MTTGLRLGPVDMTILTILAEQYGTSLDRVAAMLGVSMKTTYRKTAKWRAAHMVSNLRIRPVPGPMWVFPTRSATEALLPFYAKYWTPTPKMAAHVRAVLDVRLALVGLDLDRWVSERELRAQLGPTKPGVSRPHVHDGRFLDSEGRWWAVEVEMTAKNQAAARVAVSKAISEAASAECAGVLYICADPVIVSKSGTETDRRSDEIRNVIRSAVGQVLSGAENEPKVRILGLSEVLPEQKTDTAAVVRPGLTVIEGGASDHRGQATNGKAVSW
ncbi:hypothetical protein [Nocardia carnea]|uniref:hypothetical protein n=1 Tax=Nocardia carnea TaxID=37328 RepID=UPI0024582D8C|nr:hypothetical protein [Nocardia carnea]